MNKSKLMGMASTLNDVNINLYNQHVIFSGVEIWFCNEILHSAQIKQLPSFHENVTVNIITLIISSLIAITTELAITLLPLPPPVMSESSNQKLITGITKLQYKTTTRITKHITKMSFMCFQMEVSFNLVAIVCNVTVIKYSHNPWQQN